MKLYVHGTFTKGKELTNQIVVDVRQTGCEFGDVTISYPHSTSSIFVCSDQIESLIAALKTARWMKKTNELQPHP